MTARSAAPRFDVIVAGGGNAALCAAIEARGHGASVLLLERAPREWRAGNSKYTRNVRVAHLQPDALMPGRYGPDELVEDLLSVTGQDLDLELATFVAERSQDVPRWMSRHGVRWQSPMRGTLQLNRTNRFFLGGGKALVNHYYRLAEALGVEIRYDSEVRDLEMSGLRCTAARIRAQARDQRIACGAVVVASGGFESNLDWLREALGDRVLGYAVRGTSYNDGHLLRRLLDLGALRRGDERGHHAVAVDARGPKYDGGIVTRVDSVPFSIVVNRDGHRFADEGEDLWPMRYATWGALIGGQPGQQAFSIFDAKVAGRFIAGAYEPLIADSIPGLARSASLPEATLTDTVETYNAAVTGGEYDFTRRDGCATVGLDPPKSNWAMPIEEPPFSCFPLVPGITFTYLAVGVDRTARVQHRAGGFENVFAAGEVMAGNILLRGYLAGIGMTIGTVFGIVAGEHAARTALTG